MKSDYASIDFVDPKDAEEAIEKMHKQVLKDHELTVEKTRKPHFILLFIGEKGAAG